MSAQKIQLHYWKIRGLGEPIKILLEYLKLDYEVHYKSDYAEMMKEKEELISQGFLFANLPYIQDGDTLLSETIAILSYVSKKGKRLDLVPKEEEISKFFELTGVLQDFKNIATSCFYNSADTEKLKTNLAAAKQRVLSKIRAFSKILSSQDYVFGRLTFLDFYFAEFVDTVLAFQKELEIDFFGEHNSVYVAYRDRFYAIEEIKNYRQSERFMERPYNGFTAIWK